MLVRLSLLCLLLLAFSAASLAADEEPAEEAPAEVEQSADLLADDEAPAAEPASQTPAEEQHTCFVTGKPWEPSPGRVEVVFSEHGKLKRARFLNMGYYVYTLRAMEQQGRPLAARKISVVDYASFGSPSEHMIEVDRDNTNTWFVFTDKSVKGATAPYVFAFETREAADAFIKKNGGKVLEYSDLLTKLARALNSDPKGKGGEFGRQLMN
jgi:nitrous oxide reductase accessory protein NosL